MIIIIHFIYILFINIIYFIYKINFSRYHKLVILIINL